MKEQPTDQSMTLKFVRLPVADYESLGDEFRHGSMTADRYPWAHSVLRWPDDEPLVGPQTRMRRFVSPRTIWPDGPWDDEPDVVHWAHPESGLPCLIWRSHSGVLNGYVGVAAGHPLFGVGYDSATVHSAIMAHGGLTFAGELDGAKPSLELDADRCGLWWFGFDCMHAGDVLPACEGLITALALSPERESSRRRLPEAAERLGVWRETYKTIDDLRLMTEDLAEQLAHAATLPRSVDETLARLASEEADRETEGKQR